jgi:hypothetical protein
MMAAKSQFEGGPLRGGAYRFLNVDPWTDSIERCLQHLTVEQGSQVAQMDRGKAGYPPCSGEDAEVAGRDAVVAPQVGERRHQDL